jgi:hypothetical protein
MLVLSILLIGGVTACQSSSGTPVDETEVREYADPATETTLQGLSDGDLAKYTEYANAEFKAALTQEKFDTSAAQINSQLGAYQSKEFLSAEENSGYIIVHYRAYYANEEVGVRMVFDADHLVAGQWFE